MSESLLFNAVLVVVAIIAVVILSRPKLRNSESWQATLTPLSSIIGSGFLVMAPLLASIVGMASPLAVLGIVVLAYAIGHVIRFNIRYIEPHMANGTLSSGTREIEYLGNLILGLAYMVAVAFYLSLLSSFLLNYLGIQNLALERWLTTLIIIFIAVVGYRKGLGGLERLESISMTIQLSIVVALLLGLAVFAANFLGSDEVLQFDYQQRGLSTQLQMLAGALLVVQGFETSRFLGEKYSPEVRVKSMRRAQLISGLLYVVAVILLMPVVQYMNLVNIELSEIVQVTGIAALVLPLMLIVAAIMSQFSAAVADTGGAGGLFSENSNRRLSTNISYVGVSVCAILLVWAADLLEIIAMASRAFAVYYLLQTLLALFYCFKDCPVDNMPLSWFNRALYVGLILILAYVVVFAIPAE